MRGDAEQVSTGGPRSAVQLEGEQQVRQLGLAVGGERAVAPMLEVQVVDVEPAPAEAEAGVRARDENGASGLVRNVVGAPAAHVPIPTGVPVVVPPGRRLSPIVD